MNNKRIVLLSLIALVLVVGAAGCGYLQPAAQAQPQPVVGNDRDAHGCIASAGYAFSKLKKKCIRFFEEGIRLNPQASVADKSASAFVVFSSEEDMSAAEVSLPTVAETMLLPAIKDNGAGTWKNASYTLSQWKGMYTLENSTGVALYQGSVLS